MSEEFKIRQIDDIVRYYPTLKIIRLLYRGAFYDATIAGAGIEPLPRPDMYSALWISSERLHPIKLDETPSGETFRRSVSVAILYPKSLSVKAQSDASPLSSLSSDVNPHFDQETGSYFTGVYTDEGSAYGLFITSEGEILLKSKNDSIVLGSGGITVSSSKVSTEGTQKSGLLFKQNPLGFIPSTIPTAAIGPLDWIDLDWIDSIKAKITPLLNLLKLG